MPGEKLYEELFNSYEKIKGTPNPKINMAISNGRANGNIVKLIESLNNKGSVKNKTDLINMCNSIIENGRKHERFYVSISYSYFLTDKDYHGDLVNISYGGFSTNLDQFLARGEIIKVNILLPLNEKKASMHTIAEVVWMCNGSNCYRYGFRFENVDERQRSVLREYLGNQVS